jgi:hypothetical protein
MKRFILSLRQNDCSLLQGVTKIPLAGNKLNSSITARQIEQSGAFNQASSIYWKQSILPIALVLAS